MHIQPGWAMWLTGLPGSGKTTLAHTVCERLQRLGVAAIVLDSDAMRALLTPHATYTVDERDQFYHALIGIAGLLTQNGCNVLIAATGNQRVYRQAGRAQIPRFAEVWVRCELAVCQARDPKGLYARAAAGTATTLPGVGASYEPPETPDIVVDTDQLTVDDAATLVVTGMVQIGL